MKKSKIGVFALLGVLSLSAVTATVMATSDHSPLIQHTDAGLNCAIKWDSTVPTKTVNGKEQAVVNHVRTIYHNNKGSKPANMHARFEGGGYMATSNEAYDPTTGIGGKVNGLESVTVNFTACKGKTVIPPDVWNSPAAYEMKLKLIVSYNGLTTLEKELTSGETVNLAGVAGNEFKLLVIHTGATADITVGEDYDSGTYVDIKDVAITCTALENPTMSVNVTPEAYDDLEWFLEDVTTPETDIDTPKTTAVAKKLPISEGQTIKVRAKKDATRYFDATGITVTNASGSIEVTEIAGEAGEHNTYSFVVKGDVTVNINADKQNAIYPDRAFVGTYTIVEEFRGTKISTAVLDELGNLTYDSKSFTYTADENDNITVKDQPKIAIDVIGDAIYINDKASYNQWVGLKGEATLDGYSRSATACVMNLKTTSASKLMILANNKLLVNGENVNIEILGGTTVATATGYIISADKVDGKSTLTGLDKTVYTVGTKDYLRYKVEYSKPASWARGKEAGTYTGELGDLVLDGFDGATLGGTASTYKYNSSEKIVSVGSEMLIINTTAHTYTVKQIVKVDPWKTNPMSYENKVLKATFTFDNGKVTLDSSAEIWANGNGTKTTDYTFENGIVKFTYTYTNPSDDYWEEANFVLEITDLTEYKTLTFINGLRTVENTQLLNKGATMTYVVPAAPVEAIVQPGTYKSATNDLVIEIIDESNARLTGPLWLDSENVTYTTDRPNSKITIKANWSVQIPGDIASGNTTITLSVVSKTQMTIASEVRAQDMAGLDELLIAAGTTFDRELTVADVFTAGTYKPEKGDKIVFGDKVTMPSAVWVEDGWAGTYTVNVQTKKITFTVKPKAEYFARGADYPMADDVVFEFDIISKTQIKLVSDATCTYYDFDVELGTEHIMAAGTTLNLLP